MSTAREATKQVHEVFGVQVSEVTVRHGLCRAGLQSHVKEKKPHLSSNNIRARLEFTRKYQHWTIDDWSHVIFSKLIDFLQMGEFGVGFVIPENFQSRLLFRLLSMVVVL